MFPTALSNSTNSFSEEASVSSGARALQDFAIFNPLLSGHVIDSPHHHQPQQKIKKKRNLPGNPDPDAEVIALSPKTLLATNRFVCEICNKGFQRDQNLQLHRRGHNLPWKLKQRNSKEIKKRAYVCPEPSCVHHHPSRALGDLTGIKKHFCRKHGEKKWKCEKCSKIYAVQSDWKAHTKTCGTREYRCDCGTLFSRKDSFITHRAFCDALAEESARLSGNQQSTTNPLHHILHPSSIFPFPTHISLTPWHHPQNPNPNLNNTHIKHETHHFQNPPIHSSPPFHNPHVTTQHSLIINSAELSSSAHHLSATALLQKAATIGAVVAHPHRTQSLGHVTTHQLNPAGPRHGDGELVNVPSVPAETYMSLTEGNLATWRKNDDLTRDFLGLTGDGNENDQNVTGSCGGGGGVNVSVNMRDVLTYAGALEFPAYERDESILRIPRFGFAEPPTSQTWEDC